MPQMLVDASNRSIEVSALVATQVKHVTFGLFFQTTIFGVKYPSPILIAPVGVQGILHPDGELATARAAGNVGVPYIMSTAATRSIEDVAKANGPNGRRWYQLYWQVSVCITATFLQADINARPRTAEVTLSILGRAKANGFTALVVTLDTMHLGWRPHDLRTAYLPFLYGAGTQVGTSDPVFMKRLGLSPRVNERTVFPFNPQRVREAAFTQGNEKAMQNIMIGKEWLGEAHSGVWRTWDDLQFIRANWQGPIVLKGIQRVSVRTMNNLHQFLTQLEMVRRTRKRPLHVAWMVSWCLTTVSFFISFRLDLRI